MSPLRWALQPYRAPFAHPIATAHGLWTAREGFWVACRDADGVVGLGEVAPLPAWGTESLEAAGAALREGRVDRVTTPAAYAGVEVALLDLQARRAGVPLCRLLGEPVREHVAVNRLLRAETPEELVLEAQGFSTFKLKVGARPLAEDVARVRAVREAIGPGAELRLDANGGWSREAAIAALSAFAPFGPAYVEQPVAASDLEGLVVVQRASGVLVAADEAVRDLASARRAIEAGVGVIILKALAVGGLEAAGEIAETCHAAGARLVLTSVLDRGVGTAAVVHLAATLPDLPAAGLDVSGLFADGPALEGLTPVHGEIHIPKAPGLGLPTLSQDLSIALNSHHLEIPSPLPGGGEDRSTAGWTRCGGLPRHGESITFG